METIFFFNLALSASSEYLCYGYTTIINVLLYQCWDFRRENMTSIDVEFRRPKSTPAIKELMLMNFLTDGKLRMMSQVTIHTYPIINWAVIFGLRAWETWRRCSSRDKCLAMVSQQCTMWSHCPTLKAYNAGIDFSRQNLASVDVRFWRLKSIPAL